MANEHPPIRRCVFQFEEQGIEMAFQRFTRGHRSAILKHPAVKYLWFCGKRRWAASLRISTLHCCASADLSDVSYHMQPATTVRGGVGSQKISTSLNFGLTNNPPAVSHILVRLQLFQTFSSPPKQWPLAKKIVGKLSISTCWYNSEG